jgi:RNA polymerase sigma-70 factor (ECF subfamily)
MAPSPQKSQPTRNGEQELADLIYASARSDQAAFSRLYDLTHRTIFGLALRVLGNHSLAEEVTIDVYLQAWNQARNYSPERGKPLTWLLVMARSRAIDRLRKARHFKHESEPLEKVSTFAALAEDPEEASLFAERRCAVRAALAALSHEQREVIEIAYFSGLSQTEISERLGIPLGTVKTRMRSGMIKLKQNLSLV